MSHNAPVTARLQAEEEQFPMCLYVFERAVTMVMLIRVNKLFANFVCFLCYYVLNTVYFCFHQFQPQTGYEMWTQAVAALQCNTADGCSNR